MENLEEPRLLKNNWEKLSIYCSQSSIEHLERSLASLEAGADPTPSFKLYGRSDVTLVTEFLNTLRKEDIYPEWMLDYEDTRVKKFGPQGGHRPWSELEGLFMLYKTNPKDVDYVDERILHTMVGKYRRLHPQMLSVSDALQTLINTDKIQDRAAGWNTFELKKTDPKAQQEAIRMAKSGLWKQGFGYVFSRYQKLKPRIFMPMPFSLMVKQAQYFVPFLTGIQKSLLLEGNRSPFLFWADKIGFSKMLDLINQAEPASTLLRDKTKSLVFVQRDFEKMDTTTGSSQYKSIFIPVLRGAYSRTTFDDMDAAMLATTTMDIVSPTGTMSGNHGTASGAEVTNGGETVCNEYYDMRGHSLLVKSLPENTFKSNWRRLFTFGNGDDGMSVYLVENTGIDNLKSAIQESYLKAATECGFKIQADKWHISTDFGIYCQNMYWIDESDSRWHSAYPAALILNAIINPEHNYLPADWDKDYRDLDVIQKLDNGAGLPYFHELVNYVAKGMKYPLLGKDETETRRILSKYDKYRALQPVGERFNKEDWSVSASPTIKYLLSLRHEG